MTNGTIASHAASVPETPSVRVGSSAGSNLLDSIAVGAISAIAGIITLGRRPLWMDEAIDVQWTHFGWHDYLSLVFTGELGQTLWMLLLKPWLSIAGHGEIAARAPSVLFAACACALLVPVGRDLFGSRFTGLAAGLLMACNAFVVSWGQQARTYALALLASVVVTYLFLRAIRSTGWAGWIVYGLAAGLAVYAHFFVGLVVVAHAASALAFRPRPVRPPIYAAVIAGLLALPAAAFAMSGQERQSWIPPLDQKVFTDTIAALAGGRWLLVGAVVAGAGLIGFQVVRWKAMLVICWLVMPIGIVAVISIHKPLFLDRYLIVVVPAASLCSAYLLSRVPRWWREAALVAACAWALGPVAEWYRAPLREDWRAAAEYIDANRSDGEHLFVTTDWLARVIDYYMVTRPDSTGLRGEATWVVAATIRRDAVAERVRTGGYRIAERREFPGVIVVKAVRR